MFFLGISAHLFIYLLVPALLVVCFYFRGVPGNSEAITLLPEIVIYEQTVYHCSEETYTYNVEKQQKMVVEEDCSVPESSFGLQFALYHSDFYHSSAISGKALRAPPVFS